MSYLTIGHLVTIYNNVADCNADGLTAYRILESDVNLGVGPADCFVFGRDMPGVRCTQFTHGGAQSRDCTNDELLPMSVGVQPEGTATCSFSTDQYCSSSSAQKAPAFDFSCQTPELASQVSYQFGSFKCSVSN